MPGEEHNMEDVFNSAEVPAWIVPQLQRLLEAPGLLDSTTDLSHLSALVAEGHRDGLTSHRRSAAVLMPRKSTMPGVPLAGSGFNACFSRAPRI
eukprot:5673222-Pyramimonas_sp.AAC.1